MILKNIVNNFQNKIDEILHKDIKFDAETIKILSQISDYKDYFIPTKEQCEKRIVKVHK